MELSVSGNFIDYKTINLKITVSDTGIGIRKDKLASIFGSFENAEDEKNPGPLGAGLGLAITDKLVKLMGGKLSVRSEYGSGSEFTLIIPQEVIGIKTIEGVK